MDRRSFLKAGVGVGAVMAAVESRAQEPAPKKYQQGASPWPLSLNTSTIRPATLQTKIDAAAEAGYDAIEPWIDDLEKHEQEGGDLKELGAQIRDKGLFVPNVIGLWSCMPMAEEDFQASLEATRERMRRCAAIRSQHVAAIPAPDRPDFDLKIGIQRYRELLRIGREDYGIVVAFEFVGFLEGVYRFGQAAGIAIDANDPTACLVMDTFHLYRGGSGFEGIRHVAPGFIANFHWNDVPNDPPQDQLGDEHRIYPGDGILPLNSALQQLRAINYTGCLSLELFNRAHWEQDPKEVARMGKEKMLANIAAAGV